MIAARGLSETRLADVAERAGVSAGLLIYYFGSKEQLLSDALAHAEDRFHLLGFHDLLGLASPRDQLLRLIELSGVGEGQPGASHWTLWLELWVRALRDPDAARLRAALARRWRGTIAEVVRAGQRAGEFAEVDVDEFAVTLSALMDGLAVQVVLGDPSTDTSAMQRRCAEFASRELRFALPAPLAG